MQDVLEEEPLFFNDSRVSRAWPDDHAIVDGSPFFSLEISLLSYAKRSHGRGSIFFLFLLLCEGDLEKPPPSSSSCAGSMAISSPLFFFSVGLMWPSQRAAILQGVFFEMISGFSLLQRGQVCPPLSFGFPFGSFPRSWPSAGAVPLSYLIYFSFFFLRRLARLPRHGPLFPSCGDR